MQQKTTYALALLLFGSIATAQGIESTENTGSIPIGVLAFLLILAMGALWFGWYANVALWLKAKASRVVIGTHELAIMRYKGVQPSLIVNHLIKAKEAGIDIAQHEIVGLYLSAETAKRDEAVQKVVDVMVMAQNAGLKIELKQLIKHYHAKVDIEKVVKQFVHAHNSHVKTTLNELAEYSLAHVDVHELVEVYIKAMSANLATITMKDLVLYHHAHVNIQKLIDALITAKEGGLIYAPKKEEPAPVHHDEPKRTSGKDEHADAHADSHGDAHGAAHTSSHDDGHGPQVSEEDKKAEKQFTKYLVEHYHSGGDIINVVNAVVAAKNADEELDEVGKKLNLTFPAAANIDLAGIDIMKAVKEAIQFKVVETERIKAYAGDGIELIMKCRVTIRPKIRKIIKGAGEETILARINEGIVTAIGLTPKHSTILESPYLLADKVEQKQELFEDTAYDVISIDISNVEVGRDIQAELKMIRAKADLEEERVRHMRIESEVQKAMADAFRDGTFSISDYHKLKNMEADTDLRDSMARNKKGSGAGPDLAI